LICANQDHWARWLPLATTVHNNSRNTTTGFTPNELLIGWEPPLSLNHVKMTLNQKTEDYMEKFQRNQLLAIQALNKVTYGNFPITGQRKKGEQVWLEAKNLPLSHGTIKLAPRRHRPFCIMEVISPVASQLDLPASRNIHSMFHNSLLTPFVEMDSHGPNFTQPPPDLT
jgi:hypothetical protein